MMPVLLVLLLMLIGGGLFYFGARYFSDKATDKDGFLFGLMVASCFNMLLDIAFKT